MAYGLTVEVVDDPALTTGSSTLDLLQRTTDEKGDDAFLVLVRSLETAGIDKLCYLLFFSRQVICYFPNIGACINERVNEDSLAGSLIEWHPWPAERPARTVVEVNFNRVSLRHILCIAQRLHPLGREIRQFVLLIALDAINRSDLHGANTSLMQLVEVPFKVSIITFKFFLGCIPVG